MRFKKGSRVEILTHKDVPSGSWRCGEIIGGNGHYYTVRYDGDVCSFGKAMVQRVPRKAIRPCPPAVDVMGDWVCGDVVEVFHNYSWKMATILMVSGWSHLLVRLFGSTIEVKAHKYDVRARLCWQDGEWTVLGKASNVCEDMRFKVPSSLKKVETIEDQHTKKGEVISARAPNGVTESHRIPSRALKRKLSHCHDQIEGGKIGVGQERRRLNVVRLSQLPKKVDNVASSREVLMREKCIHSERKKRDGFGCSRSISLEPNDDVSVSSSVGSCSVYRNHSDRLHNGFAFGDNEKSHSSDAESFCEVRFEKENCDIPTKEELKEEIHMLELHAYRSTIEALHASGPLSWEQELLLTNLRDSLHISNDEHLREVRSLVSPSSCIPSF